MAAKAKVASRVKVEKVADKEKVEKPVKAEKEAARAKVEKGEKEEKEEKEEAGMSCKVRSMVFTMSVVMIGAG